MAVCHLLSFILSILLLFFISPSVSFSEDAAAKSQKVKLSLYYESLCPYCANFIENELVNVFKTDLSTIVNLRLVPFGNAQIFGPDKRIICQHGENECYLNTIHACAINAWPDFKKHYKLIQCIEGKASSSQQPEAAWRKCCDELGFSQQPIDSCYQSGKGTKLVLKYGEETDSLKPPHRFVPWVTVNGQALEEARSIIAHANCRQPPIKHFNQLSDFQNYIAYVCKAYEGKFLPSACKSHLQESTVKETPILPVCYKAAAGESADIMKTKLMKMEPPI